MAVKIPVPKLEKIQPNVNQGIPQQRIQAQARDYSGIIRQGTRDISELGEQGVELYTAIEDKKIGQLADQAELNYANWNEKKLIELEAIKGDPSEHYEQYEKEEREYSQTLMENSSNVSPRVKRILGAKFDKMRFKRRSKVIRQRELAKQAYGKSLYDRRLKLHKEDLPISTASVKVGDRESLAEFEIGLNDINKTILRRGIDEGTIEDLGEGKFRFKDDTAKYTLAKERSEAIANSVSVLINEGDAEKAKFLLDEYGASIEPLAKSKLIKKLKTDEDKNLAYQKFGKMRNKSDSEQLAIIDRIKDEKLRDEVLKIKAAQDNKIQSIRDRSSKQNYNTLANHVLQKMTGNNPYHGLADLENDPLYKETWDNITDNTQRQSIQELVQAPKTSSNASLFKVQKLLFGEDENYNIETITPEEFAVYLAGMDDKTRKRYTKEFERLRTETTAEQRANYNFSRKLLVDELIRTGQVRKNAYGKFNKRHEKDIIESTDKLMEYMQGQYGTFNVKQTQDFIKEYVKSKVEDRVFNPEPRRPDLEKKTGELVFTNTSEKLRFVNLYKDKFNSIPKMNSEKFKKFVRDNR